MRGASLDIAPYQFYAREKPAREGALERLARRPGRKPDNGRGALEEDVRRLRAVIAELSAENLALEGGLWA